ncbi:MAG: Deoxyribose-phosphate aldolase 1 [bacterium ADurb.Bin243]|nr:MAG: Deoxyribose-phosphate aldolase 1 [bacterium ADurb.Bin243]
MIFSKTEILDFSNFLIKAAGVSREALGDLIEEARASGFVEILVPPFLIRQAAEKLKGSNIKIAAIIDFPYGLSSVEEKSAQAKSAAAAGASIIEISPNALTIKDGDLKIFEAEYALIASLIQKTKGATVRVAVNELILSDLERDSLCHYLSLKKIPYRVISLNSVSSSSALYSFTEDLENKIVRVNLKERSVKFETVASLFEKADEKERSFLFGRALCSAVICSETAPESLHSPETGRLVIAPAALAASDLSSSDIVSVGAKNPRNGHVKIISRPSRAARALARLGVAALIIEGPAEGFHYLLKISAGSVQIVSGENYLGLNVYEAAARIRSAYGEGVSYFIQSPMAAFDSPIATVSADDVSGSPEIQFGGGFGLLMKNFGLNAVVIDTKEHEGFWDNIAGDKKHEYERLLALFADAVNKNHIVKEHIKPYGTASLIMPLYETGALPLAFFTRFESQGVSKISGAALRDSVIKRKGECGASCARNCVIKCKNIYLDDKKQKSAYIEYEHLAGFAAMNEIYDIELTAKLLRFCREKGLDFIELSYSIGELIRSGAIKGKPQEILTGCLSEIEKQTIAGKILLKGAFASAIAFGKDAPMTVAGEALPPYDPRALMSLGVSYLTSPIGSEEKSAGFTVPVSVQKSGGFVAGNKTEGQLELSRNMQVAYYLMDTIGICHNAVYPLLENPDLWNLLVKLISLRYNIKLSVQDITKFVKKMIKEESLYNKAAGGKNRPSLPRIFYEAPNPVSKSAFGFSEDALEKIFDAW